MMTKRKGKPFDPESGFSLLHHCAEWMLESDKRLLMVYNWLLFKRAWGNRYETLSNGQKVQLRRNQVWWERGRVAKVVGIGASTATRKLMALETLNYVVIEKTTSLGTLVTVRQRHEVPLTEEDIQGALEYLRAGEISDRKQRELPGYVPSEDDLPSESKDDPPIDPSEHQRPSESTGEAQVVHEPLTQEVNEPPPTQNEPPDERPLDKEYPAELCASIAEREKANEPPHEHSLEQGKEHNIYNNINNSSENTPNKKEISLLQWLDHEEYGDWKYEVQALIKSKSDPKRAGELMERCYMYRHERDTWSPESFNKQMEGEFLNCRDCWHCIEAMAWDDDPCWRCTYNPYRRESVKPENYYISIEEVEAQIEAESEKERRKKAGVDVKVMDFRGDYKRTEESYHCLGEYYCEHAERFPEELEKNSPDTVCRYQLDEYGAQFSKKMYKCPIGIWEQKDKKRIMKSADQ